MAGLAFKTLGGEGQDIVLIHGFGSDRLSWLGNSPALMTLGRVHALDLPGHGESDTGVGDGSPQALMRAVADALDENGITRAHFVGHSLGGALSLLMADQQPERVASLSLIAPAGLGRGLDRDFPLTYAALADQEAVLAALRRLVVRPILINKMTAQRVLTQLDRPGARQSLNRIAAGLLSSETALAEAATRIAAGNVPRLVIWGSADAINPIDRARLAEFGGTLLEVPDAGHLPHIENAKAVNEALATFLKPLATP